MSFNLFENL